MSSRSKHKKGSINGSMGKDCAASKISSHISVFSSPTNDCKDSTMVLDTPSLHHQTKASNSPQSHNNNTAKKLEMEIEEAQKYEEQANESFATLLDIVDCIDTKQAALLINCERIGGSVKSLREALQKNISNEVKEKDCTKQELWSTDVVLSEHALSISRKADIQARMQNIIKQE